MRVEHELSDTLAYVDVPLSTQPSLSSDSKRRGLASGNPSVEILSNTFSYGVLKRIVDIGFVVLLAPVCLVVCAIISILVKATSPGPVFFAHRRVCRNGSFFSMWKFRTMCTNSTEVLESYLAAHPEERQQWLVNHKLAHDPRITRIGQFLIKYSLDELPQLWNVLVGDMSLVGPRPIVAAEVQKYGSQFSAYTRVKPGITGLWQVAPVEPVTYRERVALDCKYVQEWSVGMDIRILFRTLSCSCGAGRGY